MNMTMEELDILLPLAMIGAMAVCFLLAGIAFLIAAKKAKEKGSKDTKIWQGFGIGCIVLAVLTVGMSVATILLVEFLKTADPAAVLVL